VQLQLLVLVIVLARWLCNPNTICKLATHHASTKTMVAVIASSATVICQ
jgi:hypothetical protein